MKSTHKRASPLSLMTVFPILTVGLLALGLPVGVDQASSATFQDVTDALQVRFRHISSATAQKYLPETMGSGVALLDYNGDGRLDIFFGNGAKILDPMPSGALPKKVDESYWDRFFEQQPDGTFRDVTKKAGLSGSLYTTGVATGDFDNDGDPDLFIGGVDGNALYRNNGDTTFTEVTEQAGVRGSGWTSSAAFVDYDQDGRLDLIVGRYLDWSFDKNIPCAEGSVRAYCHPNNFGKIAPILFHNEGGGRFRDASADSGVAGFLGKALGIGIADFERDGLIDIFISNDGMEQFLLRNLGGGKFEEVALFTGVAMDQNGKSFAGMGVDVADFDNDGLADIIVANLSNECYALYRNEGDGNFGYVSDSTGVSAISLLFAGWGLRFLDYDNDGWRDLFITQGHVLDTIEVTSPHLRYAQPPFLLKNQGGKSFVNLSEKSGEIFRKAIVGRGLSTGDLDNDGDLDVVVSSLDGPGFVYRNEGGNAGNWLVLELRGTRSNRDGIGAEVRLTAASGTLQAATITTTSSYQSASDKRVHFGLGREDTVKQLEIRWPSGIVQKLSDIKVNQFLQVVEPAG